MAVQERFTLRNLYLYVVCLITLVVGIFAAVSLVRNIVELAYPAADYEYGYAVPDPKGESTHETEADRDRRIEAARKAQRRDAVLGLVGSGTTLLIVAPLYAYHWRKVQREVRPREIPPAGGEPPTSAA